MKVSLDPKAAVQAYSSAFRRIRDLPGFSQAQILRAEAGVILKTWAGRTKVATKDQIERRTRASVGRAMGIAKADKNNPYGVTINNGARQGFRGEVWFRTSKNKFSIAGKITDGAAFIPAWKHWKTADWQRISYAGNEYAQRLRTRRVQSQASLGLARQSVIQIADALGIDLTAVKGGGTLSSSGISKARAAIAANGRFYQNGIGQSGDEGTKSYVNMFTRLPYGGKIGMDTELARILSNRAKYIETSYQKGAFDSIRNAARAFPNLFNLAGLN